MRVSEIQWQNSTESNIESNINVIHKPSKRIETDEINVHKY